MEALRTHNFGVRRASHKSLGRAHPQQKQSVIWIVVLTPASSAPQRTCRGSSSEAFGPHPYRPYSCPNHKGEK